MENFREVEIAIKRVLSSQFGNIFRSEATTLMFGIFLFLTSLIAGWIPDGLAALIFDHNYIQGLVMLGISIGLLILVLWGAYHYRQNLRWDFDSRKADKKKVLILFLSKPNCPPPQEEYNKKLDNDNDNNSNNSNAKKDSHLKDKKEKMDQNNKQITVADSKKTNTPNTTKDSLKSCDEDLIKLKNLRKRNIKEFFKELNNSKYRSWEMPIRAIKHHCSENGPLKKVIVFTSEASDEFFDQFKDLLPEEVCHGDVEITNHKIESSQEEKAFEDIKAVAKAINDIYEKLLNEGYTNKDIIVDITGGQKVNSIAAALIAALEDIEFQYISTNDKEIKAYRVVLVKED